MKNDHQLLSMFLLLLALPFLGSGQTSWNLTGNTPIAGDFLGTTNTQPLELKTTNTTTGQPILFSTNNTEQMRLAADGNLGIGLAAPNYLLDLDDGDLNLTDGIIRIGDDEIVFYDGTSNNLGYGTVHPFDSITTGGDNPLSNS